MPTLHQSLTTRRELSQLHSAMHKNLGMVCITEALCENNSDRFRWSKSSLDSDAHCAGWPGSRQNQLPCGARCTSRVAPGHVVLGQIHKLSGGIATVVVWGICNLASPANIFRWNCNPIAISCAPCCHCHRHACGPALTARLRSKPTLASPTLANPTLAKPTLANVKVLVVCKDFGFLELIVWVF